MVFPFAFFAGVAALLAAPALPPAWVAVPVALAGVLGLGLRRRFAAGLALCGACCGFLFAGYHAQQYLSERWPQRLSDERVIARVVVDSIPTPRDSGWAFDALAVIESPQGLPQLLRVRVISRDAAFRPRAGERWRLLLTLRPPRGRANPGSQDFERQLFRDGVHALGTVVKSGINRKIDSGHRPLAALRERISRHIEAHVTDRDAAALIAALAVGDTGRVSREQWRVFNATGTTHLVAISGLHVTLFAVIAFAVARWLWSGSVWLASLRPESLGSAAMALLLRWPRETFASVVGFTAAAGYATLAGLSVPTQRTLIMLGTWLLARAMARATRPFQPLALALIAVLLVDPFAPLSAGFWLSFAAMGAIILVTSGRFVRRPVWREALAVQAAVTVVLLPFSLALFGSVSVIGPLVNALAIPAMSWVLVPVVLLSVALAPVSVGAANGLLSVAAWLHEAGWPWLAAASDVPWALLHASPPWWWYAFAIYAIAMALMPWPLMLRLAALVCVVPLVAAVDGAPEPGSAEVTILDVGEGTSVVIRTAHHVLVYGTGDSYGTDGRMAEGVVIPFLRNSGARVIDRLVLSRPSVATAAGVTALLAEMPVRQTLVGGVAEGDGELGCAQATSAWQWDRVTFELLPVSATSNSADAGHACVLSVKTGRGRVLVPGNIDVGTELRLARSGNLQADLVVVPRSGSSAASSAAFIEAVGARWAVVSGRRVQRPAARFALARWEQHGAQVLATAELGAIRFQMDEARGVMGPQARRTDQRKLWAASP